MKKLLKRLAIGVIGLVAAVVLFIVISGNHYMFFMIRHTILEGRMGPTIDEHVYYTIEWLRPQNHLLSGR